MEFYLSDDAMSEYERLERDEPEAFALVVDDLAIAYTVGADQLDRWAAFGDFSYLQGPTGRVRYWVTFDESRCTIEYFDHD